MNNPITSTALIFPFELLLPVLGILLIRSQSPINSLIYRSFLGSISALIYALVGAPDVALTEVMVGTLLSSLLYIVTIRSCYSIVLIHDKGFSVPDSLKLKLKTLFDELHLNIVYQPEDLMGENISILDCLSSSKYSGSPHAIMHESIIYFEAKSLLLDVQNTVNFDDLKLDLSFSTTSSLV